MANIVSISIMVVTNPCVFQVSFMEYS